MDRNEWHREQYHLVWSHRSRLLDQTKFGAAVAAVLGSAISAAWYGFDYTAVDWRWVFVLLLVGASLSWLAGLACLCWSILHRKYIYPPEAGRLKNHFLALERWAAAADPNKDPHAAFEEDLTARVAEATDENFKTNRCRAHLIHRTMQFFISSLLMLAMSAIPYLGAEADGANFKVTLFEVDLVRIVQLGMLLLLFGLFVRLLWLICAHAWTVRCAAQPASNGSTPVADEDAKSQGSGGQSTKRRPTAPENTDITEGP